MRNNILILVAIAVAVTLFFALDVNQYLSLSYIKASQERLQALYADHTLPVLAGFFAGYVAVTALSLPGAAVMTLAAGAFFGFWPALVLVSFASTLGATLAMLVARNLLGRWVQERFKDRLAAVNRGFEREGAFYLFTMRLIPAIPFFAINLLMGLTPMRAWTFYWVSQAGMLPGTAVFVNAGKELGQIDSLGGVLSPGLIFSFVLLGVFPLAAKKTLAWYRARKGLAARPVDPRDQ